MEKSRALLVSYILQSQIMDPRKYKTYFLVKNVHVHVYGKFVSGKRKMKITPFVYLLLHLFSLLKVGIVHGYLFFFSHHHAPYLYEHFLFFLPFCIAMPLSHFFL